jgi:hypothetical protein
LVTSDFFLSSGEYRGDLKEQVLIITGGRDDEENHNLVGGFSDDVCIYWRMLGWI